MKLAVCAQGEGLEAQTDLRFGRCSCFVLVDPEEDTVIASISNENAEAAGGAGPQSARLLSNHEVDAVVVGNVGPKAEQALQAAGIAVYTGIEGTVGDTVRKFKEGGLKPLSGASVPFHSGNRRAR